MAEPKEVIVKKEAPKEKDNSKDVQQFQQKLLDLENKVLSLTNENDKLKSMLKERNTEIDNLKVRVGSKDREIDELKTEIRKLGDKTPLDAKIKDLTGQIEIWRNKANLLEEQWDKEQKRSKDLQDSRDKYENDLKNVKNDLDQAKKLIAKLENTNQELEKLKLEIESYKKKLEEIDILRKKLDESEGKNKGLGQEIEVLKQKIIQYEEKFPIHEKEIEVWSKRCDDIEKEWGERYKSLEFEMDELGLMNGNLKETEEHIAVLMAENENWKAKCLEIETEWNEKHGKVLEQLEKLKADNKDNNTQNLIITVFMLMIEIERLNVLIKLLETERENDNKVRNSRVEKEKKATVAIDESSGKLSFLQEELAKKDRLLRAKDQEMEELSKKVDSMRSSQGNIEFLKQKILDLERQVAKLENMASENNYLKEKLKRNEEEMEKMRSYADSLRKSQYERPEKNNIESEIAKWKGLYESIRGEMEGLQRKYYEEIQKKSLSLELENKIALLANENERLLRENKYLTTEMERISLENVKKSQSLDLESKVRYLSAEIERLSLENTDLKQKYYEEISKKSQNSDLENKVRYLSADIERFSSENTDLKQKYYEELFKKSQNSDLEAKIKNLSSEMQRLSVENSEIKQKYYEEVSKKGQNFELENKIVLLSSELERLNKEIEYWRRVSQEMEAENRHLIEVSDEKLRKYHEETTKRSQMQSSYIEQDLKEKNTRLIQEIDDLKLKYQRLEAEYKKNIETSTANSNEIMNLEFELEMKNKKVKEYELILQEKNNSTYIQSEQLAKENERLRIDLDEIKRKFSLLELESYKKVNVDSENQRKVSLLQAEIDRNSQLLSEKIKENKNLLELNMQKARDVEETLIKLRISENQMTILDSKIKGLIEEIDAWRVRYENLERFKAKEFDDLKVHSEAIRKSQLDREIRDLTIKNQNEKMKLEAEIKRIQGIVEIQNGELAILKGRAFDNNKISKLEESFYLVSAENERLVSQIQGLNEKMRDLETQKLRLSEFYQEQQRNSLETTKKSSIYQVESLQNELNALQRELEDWKNKARKAELEIYGLSSGSQQLSEYKQQIMNLNKDQQGLVETLNEKKLYIEKIRQKKRVLKEKLRNSLTLEQNSQVLLREIDMIKTENMKLKEELSRIQQKSLYQSTQSDNYNLQLKQDELNRLSLRLQSVEKDLDLRIGELKDWQTKYYQVKAETQNMNEVNELRKRCSMLEYENSSLQTEISRLEEEKGAKVHHEKEKKAFVAESEDKQKKINTLMEELEHWKDKCRELENSSADKRFLEKKVKDWEQRVNALLSDNDKLLKEKALLEFRLNEIANTREEGLDKIKLQKLEEKRLKEIEELNEHLEILKNAHFDTKGIEFEAERMAYETALTQMKNKITDLERTGALIMRESEENKMILAMKLKEIEEIKMKMRIYEEKGGYGVSEESEKLRRQLSVKKKTYLYGFLLYI